MPNTWIAWNWRVQGWELFTEIKPYLCKCYVVMEDTCSSTIQAYHSFSARGKSCDGLQAYLWQGALHETLTLCLVLSQIANHSLLTPKWSMIYLLSATAILSHLTWYFVYLQIWAQCGLFILHKNFTWYCLSEYVFFEIIYRPSGSVLSASPYFLVLFKNSYLYSIRFMKCKKQTYVIKTTVIIHMLSLEQATCKMMSYNARNIACIMHVYSQLNSLFSFWTSRNYGCGLLFS